ncbi:DHS-like NAD/FAD-binding domain-containing protein [Ilyonectria robusta]|uniref:DHS-like NAD/FAD-binding domain-containing protein n=1 Tax=Ilyonectria robusta TaxID=1079257 RepID=UPI001E8ED1C4|nr:DHS-like NAD/FAD-binding domain-containing protein [Ilyonectria robusta]KAH8737307.1 DHS-like NAD/FAD-binding domain-containing protein [Ilyonectria robusta]
MGTSSPVSAQTDSAFSSPLSNLSKTPSLPSSPVMTDPTSRYPSPTSTAGSGSQSPVKLGDPIFDDHLRRKLEFPADGPPPAKRRKMTPPKERTTEYLDLTKPDSEFSLEDNRRMERLVTALRKKKKIVVIAGAGISVSAGIPDFRSSTGMFATAKSQHKLKGSGKHLFDASVYKHDASTQSFHAMVREMAQMTKSAKPTPFHHLLASLAQEGRLLRLYSQNIDCIDTSMKPLATNVPLNAKGPWPATIQLHGGLEKMVCTKCGQLEPFDGEVFDGPEAPLCRTCEVDDEVRTAHAGKRSHGIGRLRPRFVLYNEYNPDEEAIGNVSSADLKTRPDAVLVVGTTLKVPGTRRLVKEMCQVARGRRNGLTAWINVDPEPKGVDFKDCWDIVVRSKCDNVARLAALPPWDCTIGEDYLVSQEEDRESQERRSKSTFAVNIPFNPAHPDTETQLAARPKQVEQMQGIPTPSASPKIAPTKRPGKATQSKISFGGKQSDTDKPAKATKAAKPRARKPKQPAKAKPLKSTVMQTFKSVKNLDSQPAGKKLGADIPSNKLPILKTKLVNLASLPALRPQRKNSQGNFLFKRESSESKPDDISSGPPSTPTMPERKLRDTISPKSVPESLRRLIDIQ